MTLAEYFARHSRIALAFSGGVDSAYLLYAAVHSGAEVRAYYVRTAFQPAFEYRDALRLVRELGADLVTLELDILGDSAVTANPPDRCYFCKRRIFGAILEAAAADGFDTLIDGTNASDDLSDRPGVRALRELQVDSPLRLAGLTKAEIRRLSREAGLFTHDKPAYACLATRIASGERITAEKLLRTERSEEYLKNLGFSDFRIRSAGDGAKLQLSDADWTRLAQHRREILDTLKKEYSTVVLDLEVRGE